MTKPELPESVRTQLLEAAEAAALECYPTAMTEPGVLNGYVMHSRAVFIEGAQWCLQYLAGQALELYLRDTVSGIRAIHAFEDGARWQHAQMAAPVAAAKLEVAQLKQQLTTHIGGEMRLKEFIEQRRIKQCEVAKGTGLTPPLISQILNGIVVCPKKHQKTLASFLGLTIEEIQNNKITQEGKL